jgi:hypothetical protein
VNISLFCQGIQNVCWSKCYRPSCIFMTSPSTSTCSYTTSTTLPRTMCSTTSGSRTITTCMLYWLKVFHRPCRRIFGACLLDTPNWVLLVRSLAYFFVNFNRSCKVRKNCVSSFDLHGNSMHVSPTFPFRLIFILRHVSNCGVTGFRANFFLDSKWTWPEMRDMRLSCTAATWGVPVNYIHARLTSVSDVIKKWSQRWRILKAFLRVILSLLTRTGSDESATLGLCFSSF